MSEPPLADGPVVVDAWRRSDLDTLRPWLHADAEWRQWDAPYFPAPTGDEFEDLATWLVADPWQRDTTSGYPSRLCVRVDDRAVGQVSWHWEDAAAGWRRLGIVLHDPGSWGHGTGTVALRLWSGWLLGLPDTYRLDLSTWSGNDRMVRAAIALGFIEEGRLRGARVVRGERYDALVLGRLRD